jgi:hypothetical protein
MSLEATNSEGPAPPFPHVYWIWVVLAGPRSTRVLEISCILPYGRVDVIGL